MRVVLLSAGLFLLVGCATRLSKTAGLIKAATNSRGTQECTEHLYKEGLISYSQGIYSRAKGLWVVCRLIAPQNKKYQNVLLRLNAEQPDLKEDIITEEDVKLECASAGQATAWKCPRL